MHTYVQTPNKRTYGTRYGIEEEAIHFGLGSKKQLEQKEVYVSGTFVSNLVHTNIRLYVGWKRIHYDTYRFFSWISGAKNRYR